MTRVLAAAAIVLLCSVAFDAEAIDRSASQYRITDAATHKVQLHSDSPRVMCDPDIVKWVWVGQDYLILYIGMTAHDRVRVPLAADGSFDSTAQFTIQRGGIKVDFRFAGNVDGDVAYTIYPLYRNGAGSTCTWKGRLQPR